MSQKKPSLRKRKAGLDKVFEFVGQRNFAVSFFKLLDVSPDQIQNLSIAAATVVVGNVTKFVMKFRLDFYT